MKLRLAAGEFSRVIIETRISPVSRAAALLTLALAVIALIASLATQFTIASLPNILPLIAGIVIIDIICRLLPQSRAVEAVQIILYGFLYLIVTIFCGIIAAYALQRFAFPLRDEALSRADVALGFRWADYAHWVDRHIAVQRLFHFAYDTLQIQIALPLVALAVLKRPQDVRVYVLAFTIAFIITIVTSALLPAAGPIVLVDRASFDVLRFSGATPLDHLMRLREAGPLVLTEPPGGIATFPSFHSTIAVLTPLTLRRQRRLFMVLVVLDVLMLGGTITEGAHYVVDVIAGIGVAFLAYAFAARILKAEDRASAG